MIHEHRSLAHLSYALELGVDPLCSLGSIMSNPDAHAVLHCPMIQPNDADAATVGEFLGILLSTLWIEAEGFSSKRPLGNSDWQWQVYMSLIKNGLAEGIINRYGDEDIADDAAVDDLILQAIRLAYDHGA